MSVNIKKRLKMAQKKRKTVKSLKKSVSQPKSQTKLTTGKQEIRIQPKQLIATVVLAGMTYISYFLNFPNSWSVIVFLGFLISLIINYKNSGGIEIILHFVLWNLLTVPLFMLTTNNDLVRQLLILAISMLAYSFIVIGLSKLKRWGQILTIVLFSLSVLIVAFAAYVLLLAIIKTPSINYVIITVKNILLLALLVCSVTYLIERRSCFS
jgi:hypothetical protein